MNNQESPKMSDEYEWDTSRPEISQEIFERYDVRKAKQIICEFPREVKRMDLIQNRDFFIELLGDMIIKENIMWENVDPELPLIIAHSKSDEKLPIDGRHRLKKALDENRNYIYVVSLTKEETETILLN